MWQCESDRLKLDLIRGVTFVKFCSLKAQSCKKEAEMVKNNRSFCIILLLMESRYTGHLWRDVASVAIVWSGSRRGLVHGWLELAGEAVGRA